MVVDDIRPQVQLRAAGLVAQRGSPLAAVLGLDLGQVVGAVAFAQSIGERPVTARGRKIIAVPARLHVGLEVEAIAQPGGHADDRRRQKDLLQLRARLREAHDVDRVGAVDAAGQEQALAPADDLVADTNASLLVADLERLADPQVEQARLEAQVVARVVGESAAQRRRRRCAQVTRGVG